MTGEHRLLKRIISGLNPSRVAGAGKSRSPEEEAFLHEESVIREEFDGGFYLRQNPDVKAAEMDPVRHYVRHGWREGRNPNRDFNTSMYLMMNQDVLLAGINPFFHYLTTGRAEERPAGVASNLLNEFLLSRAPHRVQDITFPQNVENAEALCVIVIPEHNTMSGGIYSFFSIAKTIYNLRHKHKYEIVLMTRPNSHGLTYLRQRNFRNSEDVFRFEQITRCSKVKELYLHLPEYMAPTFLDSLTTDERKYLVSRERLFVNILNQNAELMPERKEFDDLAAFSHQITQSVAHHAYFSQAHANRYDLPTLLLPAYTDLSGYEPIDRSEKEKLIIYSPDVEPHREPILKAMREQLPDYKLLEICDITFDKFMEYASRCMFSVSFGEGFDGYVAQPIYQGGIGLAAYREEYFPNKEMRRFANIFESEQDMIDNIVSRIRQLEKDEALYRSTNKSMMDIYNSLYSKTDYVKQVGKLMKREWELLPQLSIRRDPVIRL